MDSEHKGIVFIKKILIYIICIILIPIIIYDLCIIVQTFLEPENTPSFFGIKTFSIISGSMKPTIDIDDFVIVKNVDKNDIKVNDIITYRADNEITTHRVIKIEFKDNKFIYTTKGDNNEVTDIEKVEYGQIEGKYIGKISKFGKVISLLKNKYVFISILALLIICYIVQKKKIQKKIKRKEKREEYERESKKQKD